MPFLMKVLWLYRKDILYKDEVALATFKRPSYFQNLLSMSLRIAVLDIVTLFVRFPK